jgi:hypothetical protein
MLGLCAVSSVLRIHPPDRPVDPPTLLSYLSLNSFSHCLTSTCLGIKIRSRTPSHRRGFWNATKHAARRNAARICGFVRVPHTQGILGASRLRRSGSPSGVPGRTVDPLWLVRFSLLQNTVRLFLIDQSSSARRRARHYRAGFAHSSALFWSTRSRATYLTVDHHSSVRR